ncbi:MAG: helix-turn-helix domain-containing protein [Xanthobacteraceae bacterium]|nr:helix-turn-helix domain-containing protein [Xanthobacteraceae bacterium]
MVQDASLHTLKLLQPDAPIMDPHSVVPFLIGATVGEIERELILLTLARCEGNRTHAARILGVSVRTLRNKIREYSAHGIDVPAHH